MSEESEKSKSTALSGLRAHPWITTIFVVSIVLWIGIAWVFLPDSWHEFRKVAAGIIWGFFSAAIITATRTVGKWD